MTQETTRRGCTQEDVFNKKNIPELVSGASTQAVTKQPLPQQALKMPGPRIKTVRGGTSGNVSVRQLSYFTARGFTRRPSSPRSVGVRGIGAAHILYPALQICGMTKCVVRGFTLIELLVVVLIIAILAAVALPQYQKAVNKARGSEAIQALDTLDKAIHSYYLTHGTYEGLSGDTLDITIPQSSSLQYGSQSANRTTQFQGCDIHQSPGKENEECKFSICIRADKAPCLGFTQIKGKTTVFCSDDNRGPKGCEKYFYGTREIQSGTSGDYTVFRPIL